MQGQAAFPRFTVVPPVAHTVSDAGIGQISVLGGAQPEKETSPARLLPVGLISGSPLDIEGRPADSSRRRNESTLSYREALRKQITEKEENVRREKEKKRRDAAELLDEMVVYDPWGKEGAGAPIKDKHGNIVCDLNRMHRINNNRRTSLRDETGAPISQQGHQSLLQQESYREQLKQQIEQNKRKKEEERERIRIAEEKEEMERARIRQQYEDEKRRENEMSQNQNKQRYQNESHDTKEAISNGQTKQTLPESAFLNADTPRLSPVDRVVSAPNTQPLPESKPSVPGDKQEVIRELSVFRKLLRKKQTELEFEMAWRRTVHSNLNKC
ncbi:centrosome and spindle pole-associated protein 1-like [Cyprinodon tularosa]|uniref:centrosome and spindle pole-associated protein 1-like n=1 Tax=Cyprinodon tularosa TaxID=77115 RepID=UPI0018E26B84|nr:centrosome and spindle pole-associated protein 1-like [Cyprinodon tularosa]